MQARPIYPMMDAVHCFEGTVNQMLGNGIMALFGAPIAPEDHALRACYAALAVQSAEFLYETRLFPEHAYTFTHALTHEVAYSSLLWERRRALHARIVEALEALAGERVAEQVERLAYHALRGEVWDKAVTYCQQASTRGNDRAAFREAVAAFEQTLQALAHLPEGWIGASTAPNIPVERPASVRLRVPLEWQGIRQQQWSLAT